MTQIKGAEVARYFYTALIYPLSNYYKWLICSNQINNCPVKVQGVEVAQKVWGKNIAALKGNTTPEKDECSGQGSSEYPCRTDKVSQ